MADSDHLGVWDIELAPALSDVDILTSRDKLVNAFGNELNFTFSINACYFKLRYNYIFVLIWIDSY